MLTINKHVIPSGEQWDIIIEGMRNPMNSWNKSDSGWFDDFQGDRYYTIGESDLALMHNLARAGSDHRKYMRMIPVFITITAPLYWWKEFDTYKVGTVANSCSTMHKLTEHEFTIDDFSHDHLSPAAIDHLNGTIGVLNFYRKIYNDNKSKSAWYNIIQLLPTSYNQRRTVFLNYETLRNIYRARRNHKLTEWHTLCDFIETLPHFDLITGEVSPNPCTT